MGESAACSGRGIGKGGCTSGCPPRDRARVRRWGRQPALIREGRPGRSTATHLCAGVDAARFKSDQPHDTGVRPGVDATTATSRRPVFWQGGLDPGAPAARAALQHVRVMEQAIEQRRDGGGVAEQLPPVFDRSVRGEDRGGPLVAAHDQLEQVLGRGVGQLAHAEVVDDEQGRDPVSGAPLASQPTISRFENGARRTVLYRMGRELAACVIGAACTGGRAGSRSIWTRPTT